MTNKQATSSELAQQILAHLDKADREGKFASIETVVIRQICEALASQSNQPVSIGFSILADAAAQKSGDAWDGPLSKTEQAMIDGAWEKHKAAGPAKKLPDLIVTRGGIPFEDQAEGVRLFKEACLAPPRKVEASEGEAIGDPVPQGWHPLNHMPIGDHRFIVVDYISKHGQTASGYWSGQFYAKAPVRHSDHERLSFDPIALRHPNRDAPIEQMPAPSLFVSQHDADCVSFLLPVPGPCDCSMIVAANRTQHPTPEEFRFARAIAAMTGRVEDFSVLAESIVNSIPVINVYAACEWEELSADGRCWIIAIVKEATKIALANVGSWQPIETAPEWGVAIVTDGHHFAVSQKAEADDGTWYWSVDPEDALSFEPTHWRPDDRPSFDPQAGEEDA